MDGSALVNHTGRACLAPPWRWTGVDRSGRVALPQPSAGGSIGHWVGKFALRSEPCLNDRTWPTESTGGRQLLDYGHGRQAFELAGANRNRLHKAVSYRRPLTNPLPWRP